MRFFTFVLNAFWRALLPLNLFLFLNAALLSAVLVLALFGEGIPVPDFAGDRIKAAVAERGVIVDYGALYFDLHGRITAENLSARFVGTPEKFLKAEKVCVSLWLNKILDGRVSLRNIRVLNARLGSTYGNVDASPVVKDVYFSLTKNGEWWKLDGVSLKLGRALITASGIVNENAPFESLQKKFFERRRALRKAAAVADEPDTFSPKTLSDKLDSVLEKVSECEKYANLCGDPAITLYFAVYGGEENEVSLRFESGELQFSAKGKEMSLSDARIWLDCSGVLGKGEKITAKIYGGRFQGEGLPTCKDFNAKADVVLDPSDIALSGFDMWAQEISFEGVKVDNVSLRNRRISEKSWGEGWRVFMAMGSRRFGARVSVAPNFAVKCGFSGNIDPGLVMTRRELSDIEELKQFAFPEGVNITGECAFDPSSKRASAKGSVEAANMKAMNIPIRAFSADFNFDGETFTADNANIETDEGWNLAGSFEQNIKNMRYLIRLKGDVRPMAISHFMEPWWKKIMKDFDFVGAGNFPRADVNVEGMWGKPEFIWCYVSADGRNARYRGVGFSNFSLNVWVNPSRITLSDIRISSGERLAHGFVEWLYGERGITSYLRQRLFIESTLNTAELTALGGQEASDIFDVVKFREAPRLTLNAVMFNPKNSNGAQDVFNAAVFSSGETFIEGAVMKNLHFNARSDKIDTQIDDASFEFCGGSANGSFHLRKKKGDFDYKMELYAEKMNQDLFLDFLASLAAKTDKTPKKNSAFSASAAAPSLAADSAAAQESPAAVSKIISPRISGVSQRGVSAHDPDQQTTEASAAPSDKSGGFLGGGKAGHVNLALSLSGDFSTIEKSVGSGYISVENKKLSELNILGLLSRALSVVRLPLGSFDITYANSPFAIADGKVNFSKLELGGPVMHIKGAASYDYLNDNIDSTLAVMPFGGLTMPIFSDIMSMINPITSIVQVTVKGPLNNPNFGVKVNPMNALKSDRNIVEKIRSEF